MSTGNKIRFRTTPIKKGLYVGTPTENYLAFNKEDLLTLKIQVMECEKSKEDLKEFVDKLLEMLEGMSS